MSGVLLNSVLGMLVMSTLENTAWAVFDPTLKYFKRYMYITFIAVAMM